MVLIGLNVIFRATGIKSMAWVQEASLSLHVYSVFLGMCVVYYKDKTITMGIIRDNLNNNLQKYLDIFIQLSLMGFFVIFIKYGFEHELFVRYHITSQIGISKSFQVLPLIIAGFIWIMIAIDKMIKILEE